ncbi:hypothetical protein Q4Q34_00155 [Flavivirga abyssicola]|uniref:hypothetical protein n=1 Tax=Flavivirga abyssicola TaxID=3063533 RepID=UPI0026E101BA|nr:hypothetical protein [Flavivirga sp. MEBiC07777]WVK13448.1 hypothetical protein Q4Q34_00155 [Flavivirga sp. MEBiC07777]
MKKYFATIIFSLLLLTACSVKNDINIPEPQTVIAHWNLVRTTGGLAGVDDSFPLETVVWTFNEVDFEIEIENNNTDDTKQDALDSGTYAYSVTEANGDTFLSIDGVEFGSFTISSAAVLTIDQNNLSDGSGADGFIYTFERTLEIIE